MQHRHGITKTRHKTPQGLGGQGNLRYQHDRAKAFAQPMSDRLKIDLGFATARHTVQ